jgi:hypothetical protein
VLGFYVQPRLLGPSIKTHDSATLQEHDLIVKLC